MNTDVSSVVYLTELYKRISKFTLVSEALAEFFDDEFSLVLPDNSGVTKPDFVLRGRTSCLHLRVPSVPRRAVIGKSTERRGR